MRRCLTIGILALAGLSTGAVGLSAQAEPVRTFTTGGRWLVGYVVNGPQQLLGAATAVTTTHLSGVGLYVDMKWPTRDPANEVFRSDLTADSAATLGDLYLGPPASAWRSVNVALMKVIGPEIVGYIGGGIATRDVYLQYTDQTRERSESGLYWVKNEEDSGVFPNGMAGVLFRLADRLVFQFGAETAPFGVTAGFHVALR